MTRAGLLVCALTCVTATGCSDDAPKRLSEALAQVGIKDVVVGAEKIEATCSQGDKSEVPTADLERNFLGLSNPKKVVVIAKQIAKDCEEKDTAKKKAASQKARLADTTKSLGIDTTGLDDEAQRVKICDKLTEKLPRKEPDRSQEAAKNMREWSCPPAPALAALPGGQWQVDLGTPAPKKPLIHRASLVNADGDRLVLRCTVNGKVQKPELYVQLAEKTKVKKGTKLVNVGVDGAKPAKWKANVAKDLSAIFFDPKVAMKALRPAQKVTVDVPTAKKPQKVIFEVKGVADAIKPFPKACQ
jgi:hypothetical protein